MAIEEFGGVRFTQVWDNPAGADLPRDRQPLLRCRNASQPALSLEGAPLRIDDQHGLDLGQAPFLRVANNQVALQASGGLSIQAGSSPTQALTVTANGRVGIGTTTPAQSLEVNGAISATEFLKNGVPLTSSQWVTVAGGINYAGGKVGIGTATPQGRLDVHGDIRAGNSDIYFTGTDHQHTGAGNAAGLAAIENDGGTYNALMILGRSVSTNPLRRVVKLWDYLQVNGQLEVVGNVSKLSGQFRIDHPLDPAGKYLQHSFVESPDMMNIYNGNVQLDESGRATVVLPDWFEVLNRDYRYQLTCMEEYAPVYIATGLKERRFVIAGGKAGGLVSWQITGIRKDPWAADHPICVELEKSESERGTYLYPEGYERPSSPAGHRQSCLRQ